MTYRGHIKNGQILLEEPAPLPEGARVNVELVQDAQDEKRLQHRRSDFEPIDMPGGPLSDDIIRDRR